MENSLLTHKNKTNCSGIRSSTKPGFTLVEVMISVLVFGFLTVIFASSVIVAKASSKMNGQYAQAISLCQHKIDRLRAVGFGRINIGYDELSEAEIIDTTRTTSPYVFTQVDEVSNYLSNPTTSLDAHIEPGTNDKVMHVIVTITWRAAPLRTSNSSQSLEAFIVDGE